MTDCAEENAPAPRENALPIWLSDASIDPASIRDKLPAFRHATECEVEDISNETRRGDVAKNGSTLLLTLTYKDANGGAITATLVAKQIAPSGLAASCQLGLAREALFYGRLASRIGLSSESNEGVCIPRIHYSYGDMNTGEKIVVMEDLSSSYVDSGILFGPGNPNNWERDLDRLVADAYPSAVPTSSEVANRTFLAIAEVHAAFWRDGNLLDDEFGWLRGSSWIGGNGEESWRASQGMLQKMWEGYTQAAKKSDNGSGLRWDPLVRRLVETAMAGISWEAQLRRLNTKSHFCLVHGDFWPGNVMISKDDGASLRLLDWEMAGLGSGPQELGQYVISNMDPAERRACERRLVQNYYEKLVRLGVAGFSWEECWSEYTIGGVERWLWFLVYFCGQDDATMAKWAQFFHDQIADFVRDQRIGPEDVTQPRP